MRALAYAAHDLLKLIPLSNVLFVCVSMCTGYAYQSTGMGSCLIKMYLMYNMYNVYNM